MTKAQIKRMIWNRIHSIAVNIDPIKLVGSAIVEDENRPASRAEMQNAESACREIRAAILKKSKKVEE